MEPMTNTLISGGTRGLGREASRRLAHAGHKVLLGVRELDRGRAVAADVGAIAVQLDVTDHNSVAAAIEWLDSEVG